MFYFYYHFREEVFVEQFRRSGKFQIDKPRIVGLVIM